MDEVKKTATGKVKGADHEDRKNATAVYIQLQKEVAVLKSKLRAPEYYAEDYTIEALGMILERSDEQVACISPEALKPIQNLKGLYKDGTVEEQIIRNETLRRLENIYRAYIEAGIEVHPTGTLSRKVMRAVRRHYNVENRQAVAS